MHPAFSPRKVQILFLAVLLLFAATLVWLGLRLLEQDRALARQRRLEQLEAAADRVSGAIYRRLGEFEEALATPNQRPGSPGAVVVRATRDGVVARPSNGLLYYPVVHTAEPAPGTFADGEALEFQKHDHVAAARAFRALTDNPDPGVRAGALIRLGRNLAKSGNNRDALRVFDQLAAMGTTPVGGLPAGIVALEAKCSLLEKLGRRSELRREARLLHDRVLDGRWPLSRACYEFRLEEARVWLEEKPDFRPFQAKAALSAAVDHLYRSWLQSPGGHGREIFMSEGSKILGAWISTADQLTAVVAPAEAVGAALRESGDFQARLIDADGRVVLGSADLTARVRVERAPASSKLPWTLQVSSTDGLDEIAGRQYVLGAGFLLLVGLLTGVTYLAARATSKEIALVRLQSDFVSAVSHEFRSPLSSICQIAELLNEDRFPSDLQRRRSFSILARESMRLRRLVESLLDFARMEAGAVRYRMDRQDAGELVRSIVEEFQAQPSAHGRDIRLSVSPGLPDVDADSEAIGRAIWNLLDNAIKYSPVTTPIHVEVSAAGKGVMISVQDEGSGIPPAEQKAIFRKFVRGSRSKADGVKGTGIGLAMVQHIVEGHGGEIRLQSEMGRGSRFTILLPGGRSNDSHSRS